MALTRKGTTGWIVESYGSLQTDRYGLSQAAMRWRRMDVAGNGNPSTPVVFGNYHPFWNTLACDRYTIAYNDSGWDCEAQFYGFTGNPTPIYELDMSTSEEPIETHKNFRTTIGGTPTAPLHGAKFGTRGEFLGFDGPFATDAERDEWMGIRSYLAAGATWRKTYLTTTQPSDLATVGYVETPDGSPPAVATGRTWLYAGLTWEQKGLTYQVKKEWRLSGRRGWNATIYAA